MAMVISKEVMLGVSWRLIVGVEERMSESNDTRKYGNSNLFRRLDKDNITSQSTVSIVIGTGNILSLIHI